MTDEGDRFWVVGDVNEADGNTPTEWLRSGDLVGVVDENEGGIVAYCHRLNADRLVRALRTAAGDQS